MFFKKIATFLLAITSIAVVVIGVLSPTSLQRLDKFSKKFESQVQTNSLSGRVASDGPILAVKIDDTPAAHPQAGLEDADIVYIEQVEGGLTRLAAIFSSKIPNVVGPVRSARISDIEILEQYGRVAFAYSGAQRKLLPVIAAANLEDLGAQRQSREIYANDPLRTPPTAMMLQAQKLMNKVAEQKMPIAISKNQGWRFSDAVETGTMISSVKVSWPANSYIANWSKVEQRWLLSNNGSADLAASGVHLGPTTFVIQIVSITPSEYHDKVGGVTPYSATVGSGRGYILRDGRFIPAIWNRPTGVDGTTWTTGNGVEIPFAAGQVWIALTDKEPTFTPVSTALPADAPSTTSK